MNLWGHWGGAEETKSEGHKIGMTLWLLVIVLIIESIGKNEEINNW